MPIIDQVEPGVALESASMDEGENDNQEYEEEVKDEADNDDLAHNEENIEETVENNNELDARCVSNYAVSNEPDKTDTEDEYEQGDDDNINKDDVREQATADCLETITEEEKYIKMMSL